MTRLIIDTSDDDAARLELANIMLATPLSALGEPTGVGLTQAHWRTNYAGHTISLDISGSGYDRGLGLLNGKAITNYVKLSVDGIGSVTATDFQIGGKMTSLINGNSIGSLLDSAVGYNKSGTTYLTSGDDILSNADGRRDIFIETLSSETYRTVHGSDVVVHSSQGNDVIVDTTQVSFLDGVLAISPNSTAAQVGRLYLGILGREAEATGLAGWVHNIDNGTVSLRDAADLFTRSTEYDQRYGNTSNEEFLRSLYKNVLGHDTSAAEMSPWLNRLDQGEARSSITLGFTEYQGNIDNYAASHKEGVMVLSADAIEAHRLSMMALGRTPEQDLFKGEINAIHGGSTYLDVGKSLLASSESQHLYSNLNNEQFINLLSVNLTGHSVDEHQMAVMSDHLSSGQSTRLDVAWSIAHSDEATSYLSHALKADYYFS